MSSSQMSLFPVGDYEPPSVPNHGPFLSLASERGEAATVLRGHTVSSHSKQSEHAAPAITMIIIIMTLIMETVRAFL